MDSPLSSQVIGALAQSLAGISSGAARTLLAKHFGEVPDHVSHSESYFNFLRYSDAKTVIAVLQDLLINSSSIRLSASPRYGFDNPFKDLQGWLKHDGWELVEGKLLTSLPAIEESTEVRDRLILLLGKSPLDEDAAIRGSLKLAASAFQADPPDLNAATTNTRIALETTCRRGTILLAKKATEPPPEDKWGSGVAYLRAKDVLNIDEERSLIASYTLISDGAHVPKGLTEIEWARVARTIALSLTYFLASVIGVALE